MTLLRRTTALGAENSTTAMEGQVSNVMVMLADSDIKTREVLEWRGLHLLHFSGSSCSQKTRIFLNLKGIEWVSHPDNLATTKYLLCDDITLLDIAWFIYTHRLKAAGYPFSALHPRVDAWYTKLHAKPEFAKEVKTPLPLQLVTRLLQVIQRINGKTLARVGQL